MKIIDIETFLVPPRWLFCKITTDEGVAGWGEPSLEGRADTVRTAVHELAELLVGADPLRIEDHWQTMSKADFYRWQLNRTRGSPPWSKTPVRSTSCTRCGRWLDDTANSARRPRSCNSGCLPAPPPPTPRSWQSRALARSSAPNY